LHSMEPIIEFREISKRYMLGEQNNSYSTIRDILSFKKKEKRNAGVVQALNNISFEINPGEQVGIIGRNGSGKSTLLKILSKITYPSDGKIILRGRVGSLLEVGTGFHGELTGKENIFFNGALLGLKKKEISLKYDEIVEFSGVEKFIDTPLKHYSSGMQLRLAFSVAAHLEPEILAVDEVLAVGDAEFQKKSLGKMSDVAKSGRTILFVSHNMGIISTLCNKVAILNAGELVDFGPSAQMIEKYLSILEKDSDEIFQKEPDTSLPAQIVFAALHDERDQMKGEFSFSEQIKIKLRLVINQQVRNSMLAIVLFDKLKERVFTVLKPLDSLKNGEHELTMLLPHKLIAPGFFTIGAEVYAHLDRSFQVEDELLRFTIIDDGTDFAKNSYGNYGRIIVNCNWE